MSFDEHFPVQPDDLCRRCQAQLANTMGAAEGLASIPFRELLDWCDVHSDAPNDVRSRRGVYLHSSRITLPAPRNGDPGRVDGVPQGLDLPAEEEAFT